MSPPLSRPLPKPSDYFKRKGAGGRQHKNKKKKKYTDVAIQINCVHKAEFIFDYNLVKKKKECIIRIY